MKIQKFDLEDFIILPAKFSSVSSRKDINLLDENGMLPFITSSNINVVSNKVVSRYLDNKVYVSLPRVDSKIEQFKQKNIWYNFSLADFSSKFLHKTFDYDPNKEYYISLEVANGQLDKVLKLVSMFKSRYPSNFKLIVGNISMPETYYEYAKLGVDYVKLGMGDNSNWNLGESFSVGYPLGSLIQESFEFKIGHKLSTKIIVGGGIKSVSDVIKSISLGADFVSIDYLFSKCIDSSGELYLKSFDRYDKYYIENFLFFNKEKSEKELQALLKTLDLYKIYMSNENKNSYEKVEYTIQEVVSGLCNSLRSSMSYTNCLTLEEFQTNSNISFISKNTLKRFTN